jgi:phage FluMu gp28-like protein
MTADVLIPDTSQVEAPPVLLPYQREWVEDKSQLKVGEKSRRIGLTWAEAADDVLISAEEGGQNCYYIGYNQDMAVEYIEACAMWARAFNCAASSAQEGLWEEDQEDKYIKTYTIRFPGSGKRIVAVSSRPANLRGKQGVVIIDEAAFHDQLEELLKAAMALLIWGGQVRIISTHDGDDNPFNDLVKEIRAGKRDGSVFRCSFMEAVEQGLYRRVCLRTGIEWTEEGQAEWVKKVYGFYGEDATEELDVIPRHGGGAWLSMAMIESCMNPDIPVVEWSPPADDFVDWDLGAAERETLYWCKERLDPLLKLLDPKLRHAMGSDFGRTGDLSVFWPVVELPDMTIHTPFMVELRNAPFRTQKLIYDYIADRLPRLSGLALDARGNGQALAEYARQDYGAHMVAEVMLSQAWYREHSPRLKSHFEDRTFDIPRRNTIADDFRGMRIKNGVAMPPEGRSGAGKSQRHCDAAVAAIMALYAIKVICGDIVAPIPVTAGPGMTRQMMRGY